MTSTPHAESGGPHGKIPCRDARERFAAELFDRLWQRYRSRVEHVITYEQIIGRAGATFVNDHIAFRTFAGQQPQTGIATLSRVFEALGYCAAGVYHFPDKHLNATHFQHPNPQFPKLFISELKVWELDTASRQLIATALQSHRDPLSQDTLAALWAGEESMWTDCMEQVVAWFHQLPWDLPEKQDVLALNDVSQYAAWVLVHGYHVNHFTSLINSHGVETLDDIEKTIAALRAAGVPMKADIEGQPGSKLRQSATQAAVVDVDVLDQGRPSSMTWTYAYFELAERGQVADPQSGQPIRFEGFLGPQATALFEMTRKDGKRSVKGEG